MDGVVRGLTVVSMDSVEVGHVGAVAPGRGFRLDQDAPGPWVREDAVFTVERSQIRLICNASGVARYTGV
jgi:hypothetical protein